MGKIAGGEKAMNEEFFFLVCAYISIREYHVIKINGEVVSALKAVIHTAQRASYSSQLGVCFNIAKSA
jgi:hypothetical protein